MDSPHITRTPLCTKTRETLSPTSLLERGIEYLLQERYLEGMAFLTLAREYLAPDQAYLSTFLDTLEREYAKYSYLQQTLREVSARFIEAHEELQASRAALDSLRSILLSETGKEHTLFIFEIEHQPLEQGTGEAHVPEPALYATCLCPFEVRCNGVPILLCSNRNGQTILRYLIAQPDHSATADTLMALLWPEEAPEVALRKLQVTVSILRRSLQAGSNLRDRYILYKQRDYLLNPSVPLRTDVEEFLTLYNLGRKTRGEMAASHYKRACSLYRRPFLTEDLYADWSFTRREQLRQIHLEMCNALATHYLETQSYKEAARWAAAMIEENCCDETAYRLLMRVYALEGKRDVALRQYERCRRVLLDELGIEPMPETVNLHRAITRGELTQEP
jgi:DNA-binding SARP family transcriptional activator